MISSMENMDKLVDNVGHDDDTMTFTGVNWFLFNNVTASNIYVNGNSWFGFGVNSAQLYVCNRDAKMWNFWREEGTVLNHYHFLRMRWDGYAQYNSTASSAYCCYEVVLFDTGDIFLNVIKAPENTSYLGTSKLVSSGGTNTFTLAAGQSTQITFNSLDDEGTIFDISYGIIQLRPPYLRKYLLTDIDEKLYTLSYENETNDIVKLEGIEKISADVFVEYGMDQLPSSEVLRQLNNPGILYWQDSEFELPKFNITLQAIPQNQVVFSEDIGMTHSTILGIESVEIDSDDNTLFALSFDQGKTWLSYVNTKWVTLSEVQSGMTKRAIEEISTDAWATVATTGTYKFRFVLGENGYVNKILVHYLN